MLLTLPQTSDPELEKDFIQALGEHTDERCITAALEQCVGSLSEAMYLAAAEIGRRDCPLTDDALVETETSKFFDGAVGHGEASQAAPDGVSRLTTLQFGGVSFFYDGLDNFIGPPNPNLRETMTMEHCESTDSTEPFKAREREKTLSPFPPHLALASRPHPPSAPRLLTLPCCAPLLTLLSR